MATSKVIICPYCGDTQPAGEQCRACRGLFEPLSRQATHNQMGPWFIRNPAQPFRPGCSYEKLVELIDREAVTRYSILRGPTTKQFWTVARRTPGVSHLLGYCHNCDASVEPTDHDCPTCGVPFGAYLDRNFLGLPDVRPLPWEADGDEQPRRTGVSPTYSDTDTASRSGGRPRAKGLSSFATDEELLGHGTGRSATAIDEHPRIEESARQPVSQPTKDDPVPAEVSESDFAEEALIRSLKRQLKRQRRVNTLLIVGVIILGLITIILGYAVVLER